MSSDLIMMGDENVNIKIENCVASRVKIEYRYSIGNQCSELNIKQVHLCIRGQGP